MSNNNPQDDADSHTPPPSQPTDNERARRSFRNLLWVIIVLLIGAIVGIISFLLIAPHLVLRGGPLTFFGAPLKIDELFTFIAEHIILSTVSIALLVSLVFVYARIYGQTKANFALGIFIVLLALLLDEILTYPILQLFTSGLSTTDLYYSLPTLGDVLTILAYSVFLYLSLQ
ncbi:MAG: hypothetical protein PXY39_03725 [archaeon]|nr:hypothetical protein [archaeon]